METLLDRARRVPVQHRRITTSPSPEEIDLALAYFHGELTTRQVTAALGLTVGNGTSVSAVYRISRYLLQAVVLGLVRLERA